MLITNGKLIVTPSNDATYLGEILPQLVEKAKDILAIDLDLDLVEDDPERDYPYIRINHHLEYEHLKKACFPDISIEFRAIGKEKIQLPENHVKDFNHYFSEEEKTGLMDELTEKLSNKLDLEAQKSSMNKDFKAKIERADKVINQNGQLYRLGYEKRSYNAFLHLDFEKGERIWTDKKDNKVLHTEPLTAEDYGKMIFGEVFDDADPLAPIDEGNGEVVDAAIEEIKDTAINDQFDENEVEGTEGVADNPDDTETEA